MRGHLGHESHGRIDRTVRSVRKRKVKTAGTEELGPGKKGQESQNRIPGTGPPRQDSREQDGRDRTAETGHLGQVSQDRTARKEWPDRSAYPGQSILLGISASSRFANRKLRRWKL
jgi:hypothetical protein